jgi:predicted Zn-dependent protease
MLHNADSPTRKITPLAAPDCHYLNAAQGWIELNDSSAAEKELQKITPESRLHPLFLLVRWELHANAKQWQAAHTIGEYLVANCPEEPIGWLQRSYALHAMGRTVEAFQQLLPAQKSPPLPIISRATPAPWVTSRRHGIGWTKRSPRVTVT